MRLVAVPAATVFLLSLEPVVQVLVAVDSAVISVFVCMGSTRRVRMQVVPNRLENACFEGLQCFEGLTNFEGLQLMLKLQPVHLQLWLKCLLWWLWWPFAACLGVAVERSS